MARRVRAEEEPAIAGTEESSGVEAGAAAAAEESGRRRRAKAEEEEGRTAVQITLSDEMAWRLRVIATMERRTPGELVEPLISGYLRAIRLPYDRYSSRTASVPEAQSPVSAN